MTMISNCRHISVQMLFCCYGEAQGDLQLPPLFEAGVEQNSCPPNLPPDDNLCRGVGVHSRDLERDRERELVEIVTKPGDIRKILMLEAGFGCTNLPFVEPEEPKRINSELPLSENWSECDDTALKDHFSFRSKDEVLNDDAVDSPFEAIDTESDDSGLIDGLPTITVSIALGGRCSGLLLSPVEPMVMPRHKTIFDLTVGEMPYETIFEDDLMTRVAPVIKGYIAAAAVPVVGPVVSVLQTKGEEVRKQREKFLALEEKKLALRREKIQLKRRRAGRFHPTRRASSAKRPRLTIRQGLLQKFSSDEMKPK